MKSFHSLLFRMIFYPFFPAALFAFISLAAFEPEPGARTDELRSGEKQGPVKKPFDLEEELKRVNALIKEDKNNANLFYNRAWVYENKGDLESAEKDYSKAIEINEKHADAYYNRGLLYLKMER